MSTQSPNPRRANTKGIVFGAIVILIGALFLLSSLGVFALPMSIWGLWPVILIAVGAWRFAATRKWWPLLLIALGALFLLGNLNIVPVDIGTYWPVILIAIGVWRLLASRGRRLGFPIALIVVGAIFLVLNLDVLPFGALGSVWPILLIAIGVMIAAGAIFGGRRNSNRAAPEWRFQSHSAGASERGGAADGASGGAIIDGDAPVTKSEGVSVSAPPIFQDGRAELSVVMGQAEVDFRDARLAQKPSTLEVSVVMGQATIYVPSDWVVQIRASVTMGEAKDIRPQANSDAPPDLIINGSLVMAGLTIDD